MKKIFFGMIASFFFVLFISLNAYCERMKTTDLESTKSIPEPMTDSLKNMRGFVELRNYADILMTDDELNKVNPMYQARGIIGTKAFNKKFDTQITFKANKNEGTTIVEEGQSEWENYLSALDHEYAEITPYVIFYLPYKGSGTKGEVGLYTAGKLPLTTTIGDIAFCISAEGIALQYSRPETTKVERRDPHMALNLTGKNEDEMEKRDASFVTEYSSDILYTPSFLKQFNILTKVYFTKEYEPHYEAVEVEGEILKEKTGYTVKNSTTTRVMATYNFTDRFAIINDFYQFSEGFYDARRDEIVGPRITNIFKFTYKLF